MTQSELGDDINWRGYQPGYIQSSKLLTSEYVKHAEYLIDNFDTLQCQYKARKFEEYNQSFETGLVTRDSQKQSSKVGRRAFDLKYKKSSSNGKGEYLNSDEKLKESYYDDEKPLSELRYTSQNCKNNPFYKDNLHSSSHSHLSSVQNNYSNKSSYSNSVIKYGI